MLVLNRKEGESLTIGDDVKVTLVKSSHGKARIGIDAPRSIPIVRDDAKVTLTEAFYESQKAVMVELLNALCLLVGAVKEPDRVFPDTHTSMHVKNEHLQRAKDAIQRWEDWTRGGAE